MSKWPTHPLDKETGTSNLAKLLVWDNVPIYDINEKHAHSFHELMVFKKGGGSHFIDFKTHPILDCSIHFIHKGNVHLSNRSVKSKGITVAFSDLLIQKIINFIPNSIIPNIFNKSFVLNLSKTDFNFISTLIEELKLNSEKTELFNQLLVVILAKLATINKINNSTEVRLNLVDKFIHYVDDNFLNKLMVQEFCTQEKITEEKLKIHLKNNLNSTPVKCIKERYLLDAKRLLINSNLSIKEIAFTLQFEDESYFCKYFKKHEKVSPLKFRNLNSHN